MRKPLIVCGVLFSFLFVSAASCFAGPCTQLSEPSTIYVPDQRCFQLGLGYEYQHYNVLGTTFHNQAYNTNLTMHLFDWLTGASGRLTVGAEVAVITGFDGHTGGTPSLDAKSLFFGAGPHLALPSRSRFQPWVHGLVGDQHFRFTQTNVLGSNSTLGFIVGGGVDIRLAPLFSWRFQGDYVGTTFGKDSIQSNYAGGTGIVIYF